MSKLLLSLTFVFATITFSSLSHASIAPMKLAYSCTAQDGRQLSLTIPNRTQVLIDEARSEQTVALSLSSDVQVPAGFIGFEGYLPCPPAQPGFMTCHSIQLLQLALSPELQRGRFQGALILNSETYNCQANMM